MDTLRKHKRTQSGESEAWSEYLEATRNARLANGFSYDEVEPWAWKRLHRRLAALRARAKTAEG